MRGRASLASRVLLARAVLRRPQHCRELRANPLRDAGPSQPPPHIFHGQVALHTDVFAGRNVWSMTPPRVTPPSLTWLRGEIAQQFPPTGTGALPPILQLTPPAAGTVHVVFLHGGGYVSGMRTTGWHLLKRVVHATQTTAWVPDYPLAPVAHAEQTTAWMLQWWRAFAEVIDARSVVVVGESAGGGLALALAQLAREAGMPLPARIVGWAPWLDVALAHPEAGRVDDPVLDAAYLRHVGHMYAGDLPLDHPRVSPLHGSWEGLPPVHLEVGHRDLLRPDAEAAAAAHAHVTIRVLPGALHGWVASPRLPEARTTLTALGETVSAVRHALGAA